MKTLCREVYVLRREGPLSYKLFAAQGSGYGTTVFSKVRIFA